MHNLDRLAAQHAQAVVQSGDQNIETTVTKALGVLQENGVYACFLYLLAKEKDNGKTVARQMLQLLDGLGFGWGQPDDQEPETILKYINEKVSMDLERLLLAKETLEQMLIYARYGAKARN
ncbi:hypothetical protein [Chloroflexus sp.]|uniref:hypothetical protein n=1 Tax=Chloroflexus sp. TaxID=1904827 RepID=UPI002ACE2351|nr:hypothetical protein [Chloroflexus sp.]